MKTTAVKVVNLTKHYTIYSSPVSRVCEALLPGKHKAAKKFTALNNINLDISPGESFGIIGTNGSGKSTLLQLIFKVLFPSSGEVHINGTTSGLLELGAGFNPEFSGHRNVELNGAIMGLGKKELSGKIDEIKTFADIGEFFHQPVKTYSSGMAVRLGFAIAMALNPDILIVDEALSVGDEAFQHKCLNKIKNFVEQGKTLVFVSHSAQTILDLCDRCVILDHGEIIYNGQPKQAIDLYRKLIFSPPSDFWKTREEIVNSRATPEPLAEDRTPKVESPARSDYFDSNLMPGAGERISGRHVDIYNGCVLNSDGEKVNILQRNNSYTMVLNYCMAIKERLLFKIIFKSLSGVELSIIEKYLHVADDQDDAMMELGFNCPFITGSYFISIYVFNDKNENVLSAEDWLMFKALEREGNQVVGIADISVDEQVDISFVE